MNRFKEAFLRWPTEENAATLKMISDAAELEASFPYARAIDRYVSEARPFCASIRKPQLLGDPSCRMMDLIGGFPFTSEEFPWPKCGTTDLPMQPIVQLNLRTAGARLGIDLGTDLVQVWGPVANDAKSLSTLRSDFVLRRIPQEKLLTSATTERQDWQQNPATGKKTAFHFALNDENQVETLPGIEWGPTKLMYGCAVQLVSHAHDEECEDLDDGLSEWVEVFLDSLSESELIACNNSEYLGGLGGQKGAESDASYGDGLLLRTSDCEGFCLALHYEARRDGSVSISFNYSYYI